MSQPLLEISHLEVSIDGLPILRDLSLVVQPGEVHAIMGPNGSGKSTLASVLAGHPDYEVTKGTITFCGNDLLALEADERAHQGIFLAFQHPVEIPGVSNMEFLKASIDSVRNARGEAALSATHFISRARATAKEMGLPVGFLKRSVNEGFSGGEKKCNEIMQMALLEPTLGVLDEADSGLDIDALKLLSTAINNMRDDHRSFILITHYQRLLNYIKPDCVHVIADGKVVLSGDNHLALKIEQKGYGWLQNQQSQDEST